MTSLVPSSAATLNPTANKLAPGRLLLFQNEVYAACAANIPNLEQIIYGSPTNDEDNQDSSSLLLRKPKANDSVFIDEDEEIFLYGKTDPLDGKFVMSNTPAFLAALSTYEIKLAKENKLLGLFHIYTMNCITDESKNIIESHAGSKAEWKRANADVRFLWELIRGSHTIKSNNALLTVVRNFTEDYTVGHSVYEYNKRSASLRAELESAFEDYLERPAKHLINQLAVLKYVDGFVSSNILPLTVDRILNNKDSKSCPSHSEVIKLFTDEFNNSIALNPQNNFANVANVVDKMKAGATKSCDQCKTLHPVKYDFNGDIYNLCLTCHRLLKGKSPLGSHKDSVLIKPKANMKPPGVSSAPSKSPAAPPRTHISASTAVIPYKKAAAPKSALDLAKRAVSFNSVAKHYGLSPELAALLLSKGAEPYDDEEEDEA
jgi:hypothetical protein